MKIVLKAFLFIVALFFSCGAFAQSVSAANLNVSGMTVSTRVNPPDDYVRPPYPAGTFQSFLQKLEIKTEDGKVMKYDGYEKAFQCYSAILETDIDMSQDLIHGEHMVQYLRAQYLYSTGKYDLLNFIYDDGRKMSFEQFAEGARFVLQDSVYIIDTIASVDYSEASLAEYLKEVYNNTTAASISMDSRVIEQGYMSVGDVLVQPGDIHSPGHAIMVLDLVVNPTTGERLVLLGQGYMPTQDMHIIHNPFDQDISPWYRVDPEGYYFTTAQWNFRKKHIKRFRINANAESLNSAFEIAEE